MVKKVSTLLIALFGSILLMFGCGNPYEKLNLSVSKTDIVLYLTEDSTLISSENLSAKVGGAGKGVSTDVKFSQYGTTGVNDIVSIDNISKNGTNTNFTLTAKKPGKGVIIVNTLEGNKRAEINVTVYIPVVSANFLTTNKAVKYGSEVNLSQYINFVPSDTNQIEMQYFISDETATNAIKDDKGRIVETDYAKISNGKLISKQNAVYPIADNGLQFVNVYGVSLHKSTIITEVAPIYVINVVEDKDVKFSENSEDSLNNITLLPTGKLTYDLILGSNTLNPFVFSRELKIKIGDDYVTDQKYKISINYPNATSSGAIFQLTSKVSEESRYNYTGLLEYYPYKVINVTQLKNGKDYFEINIDRVGFEGLFTLTYKIQVTVKEFGSNLDITNSNGESLIGNYSEIYNAYGGNVSGTPITLGITPNAENFKMFASIKGAPALSTGQDGVVMSLSNNILVTNKTELNNNTTIYLKHYYSFEELQRIITDPTNAGCPKLVVTYSFNLAPTSVTTGYKNYVITKEIPIVLLAGVSDIDIPTNNSLKIDAVSGKAVGVEKPTNPEEPYIISLASIGDKKVNLNTLIASITALSVNGKYEPNFDPFNNKYFSLDYLTSDVGFINRLVINPIKQANQATIELSIKTKNNITKQVTIEIFVPIAYSAIGDQPAVHLDIYDAANSKNYIYASFYEDYIAKINEDESFSIITKAEDLEDELIKHYYSTLSELTLSVNSVVGFNIFNYVVLTNGTGNFEIQSLNYNTNVTIVPNRDYYTIDYREINGVKIPYLLVGNLKTDHEINLTFKITGYNSDGVVVTINKIIKLTIVKPINNIQLSPVSSTIYDLSSVGYFKSALSTVDLNLNIYPTNAFVNNENIKTKFYIDENLVLLERPSVDSAEGIVKFYLKDFVELVVNETNNTCVVKAKLSNEVTIGNLIPGDKFEFVSKIQRSNLPDNAFSLNDLINIIYNQNKLIVTIYANLNQYDKPTLSSSAEVTIKYAKKVQNIIPSVGKNGLYFDSRNYSQSANSGEIITFKVEPDYADNKTLVATIKDSSVATIIEGVNNSGRIISNYIKVRPNVNAGRTTLTIAAEDDYSLSNGVVVPGKKIDISIRVADGSKEFPFEISNADEFMKIEDDIAMGNNSYYYVLSNSFSLRLVDFVPFDKFNGGLSGLFKYNVSGIDFEEQNTINNLKISRTFNAEASANYNFGVFKELGKDAIIENLILDGTSIDLNITNPNYNKQINVGAIAGINYGSILYSQVNGTINVKSEPNQINIGGFVGQNLSEVNLKYVYDSLNVSNSTYDIKNYGVISGLPQTSSSVNGSNASANIAINFVGSSSNSSTSNINLGGVVGSSKTLTKQTIIYDGVEIVKYLGFNYTNQTINNLMPDVSAYQRNYKSTINNLNVVANITSLNESGNALISNAGGVIGESNSTYISDLISAPIIVGYNNVGGIIGKAEHSIIDNSIVEFANAGQNGVNTISLMAYTNLGGLVGYGKNINIYYSYVRSYFNSNSIDNSNYYGNIALAENNTISDKYVGGLVGYIENDIMSEQLKNLGIKLVDFDASLIGISNIESDFYDPSLFNNKTSNGIFNSYFNADINLQYQAISGNIFAGGLIGYVKDVADIEQEDCTTISNSYVYGIINHDKNKEYIAIESAPGPSDVFSPTIGKFIEYAMGSVVKNPDGNWTYSANGNKLVKIEKEYTETTLENGNIKVNVKYTEYSLYGNYVGNETYKIVKNLGSPVIDADKSKKENILDENNIVTGVKITTVTNTTNEFVLTSVYTNQIIINNVYSAINSNYFSVKNSSNSQEFVVNTYQIKNTTTTITEKNADETSTLSETIKTEVNENIIKPNLTLGSTFIDAVDPSIGFNIIVLPLNEINPDYTQIKYGDYAWLMLKDSSDISLNNGYPVLFKYNHSSGQLMFKVLPTNINANFISLKQTFSNLSYIVDSLEANKIVLFYNEYINGRSYPNINKYKLLSADEQETSIDSIKINGIANYTEIAKINLDLPNLADYGLIADYDKDLIITSSNTNILKVLPNGVIQTLATGEVTLKIACKLNTTIYDTITILIENGVSDFNLYKTKNITTSDNAFGNNSTITEFIDIPSNYYVDVLNKDKSVLGLENGITTSLAVDKLNGYNGSYAKNNNIGYIVDVLPYSVGESNVNEGQAKLNGKEIAINKSYIFNSMNEFSFVGVKEGYLTINITPFIKTNSNNFGETLLDSSGAQTKNCIIIAALKKSYNFKISPKAEKISLDKTSATLDPTKYVDLSISVITSDFTKTGSNISINEVIKGIIFDNANNSIVGNINLSDINEGNNDSLIDIEIISINALHTTNDLKVEVIYKLRLSFNAEKYKNRTNDVTYNINNINYSFSFTPKTNPNLTGEFSLKIVPRSLLDIKASFYPNSETSGSGGNASFNPQEVESEYIVPNRLGLLKFELLPDLNDAEYVELKIEEKFIHYVTFKQKLATMYNGENSYVVGYQDSTGVPEYLPNFTGLKLKNESLMANGNIVYNGKYFVQVLLSSEAPVNTIIKFTMTAYKTVNGNKTELISKNLNLTVQPLPSINLTVNGEKHSLLNVGGKVELKVDAQNFEGDIKFNVSSLNNLTTVKQTYDEVNKKYYLVAEINSVAGETITVTANATRYINGTEESSKSSVTLQLVEYIINDVYLGNSVPFGDAYSYEILNGTTNTLSTKFNITYNENNKNVKAWLNVFEQDASGKKVPTGGGGYINNWYRYITNDSVEKLILNGKYNDFEFLDKTILDLNSTHYFAIKALKVSNKNILQYKIQYYYNEAGLPQLYLGGVVSGSIYEKFCKINLIIKDNSTYDHPNPISNETEFMALGGLNLDGTANSVGPIATGHYILINDLNLSNYYPFVANFSSLDGNGHVIKINGFNTTKYKNHSDVNVGLFESVSENTVLKNITIDISSLLITRTQVNELVDNGTTDKNGVVVRTAKIDLTKVSSFNFGMLAGTNYGSITNAKIINTKPTTMIDSDAKNLFIYSTLGYLDGNLVNAKIGGLVGINSGSISNSYVGMNSAYYENGTSSTELRSKYDEGSNQISTYPFNIVGGKSLAGFANNNSGIIANSYNLGVGVINRALIFAETSTAGFVANNLERGYIFNCMVEGIKTTNYRASDAVYIEAKGFIGGFVYENNGKVENAYSNISITTNSGGSGGFVYINNETGKISYAYSTSPNALNSKSHGQFTGIDSKNNYNNFGTFTSCYYLVLESEIENSDEPATAIRGKIATGSEGSSESKNNPFRYTGSFNGFNFASGNEINNIWKISTDTNFGPRLIGASSFSTFSHRVLQHTTVGDNNVTIYDYEYDGNCTYGAMIRQEGMVPILNPLLVNTPEEFVKFIANNSSTLTLSDGSNKVMYLFGNNTGIYYIRLINNLDFSQIVLNNLKVDNKLISDITFAGTLEGNGMSMTGIKLVDLKQEDIHENYGLFNQIGISDEQLARISSLTRDNINPSIQNVKITVNGFDASQSVKVGALAGSIYNTSLINIELTSTGEIRGRNIVGGLAGLIKNTENNLITNIKTNNITVTASYRSNSQVTEVKNVNGYGVAYDSAMLQFKSYYKNSANTITNLREYSYAGSVSGIIDTINRSSSNSIIALNSNSYEFNGVNNSNATEADSIRKFRTEPSENVISNISVSGGGFIAAEQAGGLFGYVGKNTHIKESKYLVGFEKKEGDTTPKIQTIRGHNYAGGIVGENYGVLEQVSVEHISSLQTKIDEDLINGKTSSEIVTNLFGTEVAIAIGGIAGFTDNGIILDSYSKIDVINSKAKIAGGVIGIASRTNYLSHVYATNNVYGSKVVGGIVGLYNKTGQYIISNNSNELNINLTTGENAGLSETITDANHAKTENFRLLLDYVVALNRWGDEAKTTLTNNLRNYYKKPESGYYNFTLRMPEVGNQTFDSSKPEHSTITYSNWIGSLIGKVTTQTDVTDNEKSFKDTITASNITATGNAGAVNKSRNIKAFASSAGNDYAFSSVMSSTLNSAKVSKNSFYDTKVPNNNPNLANEIFNEQVTGIMPDSDNASAIGDIITYNNTIGKQFKTNTILGTSGTNGPMFNSFAWDTINLSVIDSDSGSNVWMLNNSLPKFIVGIYSNFNEISTFNELNEKIRIVSETKNQFYLLNKTEETINKSYDYANPLSNPNLDTYATRTSLFFNKFEGTLIGNPYNDGTNIVNPKIIFKNKTQMQSIFREINNATIMNVDFEIHVDNLQDTWEGNEANRTAFGLLAKQISNSVISNCNIKIVFEGGITISANVNNFGLLFGVVKDSTISKTNIEMDFSDKNNDITLTKTNKNTDGTAISNGNFNFGLVGYGLRAMMSDINLISNSADRLIEVSYNSSGSLNVGTYAGMLEDSAINNINQSKLIANGNALKTKTNGQIKILDSEKETNKINYGGLVGSLINSSIGQSNYIGNLNYGAESKKISSALNAGGIAGYTSNSKITGVMVNAYNYKVDDKSHAYVSGFDKQIKIYNSSKTETINVGGIIGSALQTRLVGNESTETGSSSLDPKISSINASKINIVSDYDTTISVGGVVGYIINKNDSPLGIYKTINAANIEVGVANIDKRKSLTVGGIAGDAVGGGFADIYNIGNVNVTTTSYYSVGGMFGRIQTTETESKQNINKFVNYGDLYINGTIPSKNYYVGGVFGNVLGNTSVVKNGYTLSRLYASNGGTMANNEYVNGIGNVETLSETMLNNVYYVYEFMPYSNLSNANTIAYGGVPLVTENDSAKFGGIPYGELQSVLNKKLASNEKEDLGFASGNYGYNLSLPKLNDTVNVEDVISSQKSELINKTGYNGGGKLNPFKLNKNSGEQLRTLNNDTYYLLENNDADGINLIVADGFNGAIINASRTNVPNVTFKQKVNNNYGIIANFKVKANATSNFNGILFSNNFGNISNVVTYGLFNVSINDRTKNISSFVENNNSNIVGSGSLVMYANDNGLTAKAFSGFVLKNENGTINGKAYIKDCYSLSSFINTNFNATNQSYLNASAAGLVYENFGIIETSYYAGTLNTGVNQTINSSRIGESVVIYKNYESGIINKCYYDNEANPNANTTNSTTQIKNDNLNVLNNDAKVRGLNTQNFTKTITENGVSINLFVKNGLSTKTISSQFKQYSLNENYGYPTLTYGIAINTIENKSYDGKSYNTFSIYHTGQLNNIMAYSPSDNANNAGYQLISNINMANVNYANTGASIYSPTGKKLINKCFLGNNYNILDLKIIDNAETSGLFLTIENSVVSNINFIRPIINNSAIFSNTKEYAIGVLAGTVSRASIIRNVNIESAAVTIDGQINSIGLLIGKLESGTINNASTNSTISGTITANSASRVGGAVGYVTGGNIHRIKFTGTITGSSNIGGIIGEINGTHLVNVYGCEIGNSIIIGKFESNVTASSWNSNYNSTMNSNFNTGTNNGFVGGLIGKSNNASLSDKFDESSSGSISACGNGSTINGFYGIGGIIGLASNTKINLRNDLYNLYVEGRYGVGGIVGISRNGSTIDGSSLFIRNSMIGDSTTTNNIGVGGVIGHQQNGTITNINVSDCEINGSRMVGGIIGYLYGGTLSNSQVNKTTLKYKSNLDMDEADGYNPDYRLGGASSSTSFANSSFKNNFNFSADEPGTTIYGHMDDWKGGNKYLEYGGNESKTANIPGRESFKLFIGFIVGGNNSGNFASNNTTSSSEIEGIYDLYYKYNIHQIDSGRFGDNWFKFYLTTEQFKRVYNINSGTATYNCGTNNYSKGGGGSTYYTGMRYQSSGSGSVGNFKQSQTYEERVGAGLNRIPPYAFNKYKFTFK